MLVIGLAGKAGAGKDTAGAYLVENYGFTRVAFADALKESAAACFGIDHRIWDKWKNDPNMMVTVTNRFGSVLISVGEVQATTDVVSITVREFLQRYGTEAHRDIFGPNFWMDAMAARSGMCDYDNEDKRYVVTDSRFDNETQWLRDAFSSIIVKINRFTGVRDGHSSEKDVSPHLIDLVIKNNGNRNDLYEQLDQLMERFQCLKTPDRGS